jgi:hypothetical protein
MFDPTSLGQYLSVLNLMLAHNFSAMVKDHKTSAARALIQTADISHVKQTHLYWVRLNSTKAIMEMQRICFYRS